MMMLVEFKNPAVCGRFLKSIAGLEKRMALRITSRIISRTLRRGDKHLRGAVPHVISVYGKDRAGIVYEVSKLLAACRCNITDLNSRIIGYGAKAIYVLTLEADFPKNQAAVSRLKRRLEAIRRKLKVDLAINRMETGAF